MFYRLSNLATKETIESKFQVSFEYPNLYKTKILIDGNKESILSVITLAEPDKVSYAIWGLLPESFEDNWSVFQRAFNTLNVDFENLESKNGLFSGIIEKKRCVIIVTGFFTSLLTRGTIEQCYVHLPNDEPFAIGGVYSELNDGFLTCSMVVTPSGKSFREIPDVSNLKPLVLRDKQISNWLNADTPLSEILNFKHENLFLDFDFEFNHDVNRVSRMVSE